MRPKFKLRKMRSVHVMFVTIMLAVPASAFALTGATAADGQTDTQAVSAQNPLHLQVSPRRVQFGDAVSVTGIAPAVDAGRTVVLETATTPDSAWRRLTVNEIGGRGRFGFRAVLRHSGFVRVRDAATGAAVAASSSPVASAAASVPGSGVRPVTVTAQVQVARRQLDVLGGNSLGVAGTLLPELGGRVVRLQGHSATGWQTLASTSTGQRGGFRFRYTPSSGLGRRLRVLFGGDRANGGSVAPAGQLTVYNPSVASWYEDGGNTACGFHAGLGVANRSLPCGTKVGFRYGGRTVTAVVDDRGPFVGGRDWDLNQNTAAALGFQGVGTVWATSPSGG
jgi:rare lipoprotein A